MTSDSWHMTCISTHTSPNHSGKTGRKYGEEKEKNMSRKKENKVQFKERPLKQQKWGNC